LKKVAIIGAGNVGSTCAFSLFIRNTADILLIDKIEGLAKGRALDIAESTSLWQSEALIEGATDYENLPGTDVVVITAGIPRKPGMSRKELLETNAGIMKEITGEIKIASPEAVIIVVANPVDSLTYYAIKENDFNPKKVIGMSGTVDGTRLRYFTSQEVGKSPNDINAGVVGPHADDMVPFIRQIDGEVTEKYLSNDQIDEVSDRTKNAGAEIVNLLKTGSAFYTPGTAAAFMTEAVIKNNDFRTEASILLNGQYGIDDVCLGVPVVLGSDGIKEIIEEPFDEDKISLLRQSASQLKIDNEELLK
jgi:malate dehydrogenase